jgi:bifunctional ADP-heptose synthase (sugar kinase/adenylyltransferase)
MKKVLVIGDSCQDMFRYGKCTRLSPEAPVPIFNPTRTIGNGGMAINVFENIKALGIECDLITNDVRPVKTRYVDEDSGQMLLRVDEKDKIEPISSEVLDRIDFKQYEAVIISDYNKGYLSEKDISFITRKHPKVFMDSKKKINTWCRDLFCIKINTREFEENQEMLDKYYFYNLVVTKGKDGCILNGKETFSIEEEHEVRDLSGAGDTFLAALVAEFVKNNDIRSAIKFANKCASWVVTQKGVVTVDLTKINI